MNKAFIIEYNDELGKYQIKSVDVDTVAEGTVLFETKEDANGGYIAQFLKAKGSDEDKYFSRPSLAYQD